MHLVVKDEVELYANDRIEIYVKVQDAYGINYKRVPEWTNGSMMEINDKNGKILFENDFIR